jgi:hypothetical protein
VTKREAVDFLHKSRNYSRRISAQLAEIALLSKSSKTFELALREALEKATKKEKK